MRLEIAMIALAALAGPTTAVVSSEPAGPGPVLVLVAPWQDGAAMVGDAGGYVLAAGWAPLGLLAASESPGFAGRLRQAGALAVADGAALATLCGV